MIRAVIVDDEAPARDRIRHLLELERDVDVVGEAANGSDACETVRELRPDVLFLDVQMPDVDGLELLVELGDRVPEFVIFVTAYDQYALKAFEHAAVDYLLKPFDPDRFAEAVSRVRGALAARAQATAQPNYISRIAVRSGERVLLLKAADIDWVEAQGNYVVLHSAGARYILRDRISAIEARLDPAAFVRIHRSTVVNVDRIRDLHPLFHGEYTVVLTDGTRLTLSRRYRDRLQDRWGRVL